MPAGPGRAPNGGSGFSRLPGTDPALDAALVPPGAAPPGARTASQTRWRKLTAAGLAFDLLITLGLYAASPPSVDGAVAGAFGSTTSDLLALGATRTVLTLALLRLALCRGVPPLSTQAPHRRSPTQRGREDQAEVWRHGTLAVLFAMLTVGSVVTGVKCVVFRFPDRDSERLMAPVRSRASTQDT